MIHVVIADDQPLVRAGLRMILAAESDMEVVGEANDGADAILATRTVTALSPAPRVLILTTFDLDEIVYDALRAPRRSECLHQLTSREVGVLRLVAHGMSNSEIAAELVVFENTVKTHVAHILAKMGARDRVQAVVAAYEMGLAGR